MSNKKNYQDLNLVEAKKDAIVLAWGRFNPPTTGHEKLIKAVVSEAKKRRADYRIYPTKSIDPKKNPLTFKEKVRFMKQMFPKHARNISSEESVNTLIKAVQKLESEGYKTVTLIAGSDRITEFKTLLNKYNGKEYNFDSIDVVSAGDRDPDAEDVSGMSASKMRAAASAGDFNSFKKGVPNKKIAKKLYDAVRKGMKVNERFEQDGVFEYVQMLNEDSGVVGSRFNRLLRFGLATGGTGDIPLTKRAFKDFEKSGSNPMLRNRIFSTIDRVFDYLLTDDVLYYRFLMLLHRQDIFGEGNESMKYGELKNKIISESDQTAVLSTADEHPEKMNFVGKFPSAEYTDAFIKDMEAINLIDISWKSNDGTEVQFYVRKSTSGQELPSGKSTQFGSEARVVDIAMKHGGKISRFDGDVREGVDQNDLIESILDKSWKSDIAYDILSEVYVRGLNSWDEECNKKQSTTRDQWAFARLNSFIAGGKAQREDDQDLWQEHLIRSSEDVDEIDEAFIAEIGKFGKAAAVGAAGMAYALWRKNQKNKKKQEVKPEPKKPEPASPQKKSWRSQVDWNRNEEYVNEQFESQFSDINEMFAIETAGEEGTTKLNRKYRKDTPGQEVEEEAPPSDKAERFITKNKKAFKDRYGDEWKQALYATAWKMHNKHFSKE